MYSIRGVCPLVVVFIFFCSYLIINQSFSSVTNTKIHNISCLVRWTCPWKPPNLVSPYSDIFKVGTLVMADLLSVLKGEFPPETPSTQSGQHKTCRCLHVCVSVCMACCFLRPLLCQCWCRQSWSLRTQRDVRRAAEHRLQWCVRDVRDPFPKEQLHPPGAGYYNHNIISSPRVQTNH